MGKGMFERVLIANRGEIAIRIARAAAELEIESVAVFATDDAASLHVAKADRSMELGGTGAAAYLDVDAVVAAASASGCDCLHPGYGFLSESSALAAACAAAGLAFIGPEPATLDMLGDKTAARALATSLGVPVLAGTGAATAEEAEAFVATHGAAIIKAVAGGGGRGMRVVREPQEVGEAFARASSEAKAAFGNGALYVERLMEGARHIEVQVLGDGSDAVHLGERDCSIQRRHQKLIEIAPAPGLPESLRADLHEAALTLARACDYRGAGTFEFLVDTASASPAFAFIEANPRLQVEHTVTEEVTGIDLVRAQFEIAAGRRLAEQELDHRPAGFAIQARVNMERMTEAGDALPAGGVLAAFDPPSGPGLRTDTFGYAGYATSPRYDSLLAKVVASSRAPFRAVAAKLSRALREFRIEGVDTNIAYLRAILDHPEFQDGRLSTGFAAERPLRFDNRPPLHVASTDSVSDAPVTAGAKVDADDPLAVLAYGRESRTAQPAADAPAATEGEALVTAPLQGTVVSIDVAEGDPVAPGRCVAVMESMKMEHEVRAEVAGIVRRVHASAGDTVYAGHALLALEEADIDDVHGDAEETVDPDHIRPDLEEVLARHAVTLDDARPKAVARRRAKHLRTARENVEDLVDAETWVEYGPLVIAAQRRRRSLDDLIANTPADGMITGVGSINGEMFDDPANRCAVMAYDYTVLAGTQGAQNHRKTDRMIGVAREGRMPMVLFAEGGGGRPGDTDMVGGGGGQGTFSQFATLSGLVPMVGITAGRCFAGNASLLGCCDVIIATADANIGMGGPAMIEGGGLGVFAPEEIGPMSVQVPSGVVDLAVADEAEAVAVAKRYLSFFQGNTKDFSAPDQRAMRHIVPENRLRAYDIRDVIATLADEGSVLDLRPGFGFGMVTSLIRIEGRPVGVIANNPLHLGGAIDSDAADKGARFMQLCDAFDIPILHLCDTPGIMVGPEIEKTALVRHSSRMFLTGANLGVPFFTVVIRKAYGLGAIAMAGGSYKVPFFTVAWPTGEFGGMGLEGSVKLGFRKDLEAIEDPAARLKRYEEMVANAYENGKALNTATHFSVDDTIDPAHTRHWLSSLLRSVRVEPRRGKKRPAIDAW